MISHPLDGADEAFVAVDEQGVVARWNGAAEAVFGWSREEAVGRPMEETIVDPRTRGALVRSLRQFTTACDGPAMGRRLELTARHRDGREVPVEVTVFAVCEDERWTFNAFVHDTTDRREAEASSQRLAAIVESSGDAIFSVDLSGVIQSWNRGAEEMYGYRAEEIVGRDIWLLRPPGDTMNRRRTLDRIAADGVLQYEAMRRRKDGTLVAASLSVAPIKDAAGVVVGAATVARDVTESRRLEEEKRRLEERLQQAERLESVGQLAGGVAHDFNNLLAVILNYAGFVGEELPRGGALHGDVEEIRRAAERAAALTRQLLLFSRREVVSLVNVDVNATVAEIEKLLRRSIGEHVELVTRLTPHACVVRGDPGQLEQVVVNLAVNARDAMPSGGDVTIETERVEVDSEGAQALGNLSPGPHVRLTVSDTGDGMEAEVRRHALEPFFTTKERGHGSGLGLATAYGIVVGAGGHLDIDSAPGEGTVITLHLPACAEAAAEDPAPARGEPVGGGETVLLVEDEDAVREVARRILYREGYHVLTADGGEGALDLLVRGEEPVDLLFTDIVMPRMSGAQLAARARDLRPGIGLLYTSGYTEDTVVSHGVNEAGVPFLRKPFDAGELKLKVREALDDRNPAGGRVGRTTDRTTEPASTNDGATV